jgi:glycosyltransferase involved in cell wall biosynthesis
VKKIVRTSTIAATMSIVLKGQLRYLNEYFDIIGITSKDDKHFRELQIRENVKMISVPMSRKISILKDILSLFQLIKIIKIEKPVIVHSITPKAGLLTMLAAKIAGVPIRIHTFTGLIFPSRTGVRRFFLLNLDRLICLCATNVYPEGEGVKKDLINNHVTNKKLKVIANGNINGINTDYFRDDYLPNKKEVICKIRKSYGIDENDIVFVFVGRINKEKGIRELIEAFNGLQKLGHKNTKLLLVGLIDDQRSSRSIDLLIKSNENILFLGRFDDVRPYYLIGDIYVHPSYREGFPNSVLEAGAMGLPSIVTDINGSNEIIRQNFNGLIVPVKSTGKLMEAMMILISNTHLRQSMSFNSRQNVEELYNNNIVWKGLLNEYNELLREKNMNK